MTNVNEVLARIGLGVMEAVEQGGSLGAPSGVLYAALMAHGASKSQFDSLMGGLVGKGKLTLDANHCYHLTKDGTAFLEVLRGKFGDISRPPSKNRF